jgi:alcohol dehydrogenase (quinone), cytochrome c subunit
MAVRAKTLAGFLLIALLTLVCAVILMVTYALWPTPTRSIMATQRVSTQPVAIERGRYLAAAADCAACHTRAHGDAFAGGLAIASPIGTIYSTNITPDRQTGIGNYTLDEFSRAVRHGIGARGDTLYPAMPYPSYSRISDEDIALLYDYFMHSVEPVHRVNADNGIPWPLSIRWPLAIWRKTFAPIVEPPAYAGRYPDPLIARGAYLVQGPGHCGACHTPRAFTLQEEAMDDSSNLYLSGGQKIDGWFAVNLRGNSADGLGGWSEDDIVAILRTARTPTAAVIGAAMGDVVVHSTQHLAAEDQHAIAAYLKTLSPAPGSRSGFAANPATARELQAGRDFISGSDIYLDNCAACHRSNGEGARGAFPKIAGNSSVLSADPSSMIRLVLSGSALPATAAAPSALGMPPFGWRLSDLQVAQLLTFIRGGWGNQASSVSAAQVASVRAQIERTRRDDRSRRDQGDQPRR